MSSQRKRVIQLANVDGVSKELFCEKTGFSHDQWYYWFGSGSRISVPSVAQLKVICETFDWSANYILFGLEPARLTGDSPLMDVVLSALEDSNGIARTSNELLEKILNKLHEIN